MREETDCETRLRNLFEPYSTRVLAYALRHIGPDHAQDVVADVFLVAWRRLDDVPEPALPWPTLDSRVESWTNAAGRTWQENDVSMVWGDGSHPPTDSHEVTVSDPRDGVGGFQTQQDLESLPTDAAPLHAYLDQHGDNADSTEARVDVPGGVHYAGDISALSIVDSVPADVRDAATPAN